MTPNTIYTYPLNGTLRQFTLPFEYLARRFVVVTLLGATRQELILGTDYRFISPTVIETTLTWGPGNNYQNIEVRRNTSATDRLVAYTDGSILRASELNTSQIQTMHIAEEARNMVADTIGVNNDGDLDARGRRIVGLADATLPDHAVTLRQELSFAASTLANRDLAIASAAAALVSENTSTSQGTLATTRAAAALASQTAAAASATSSATNATTTASNVTLATTARTGAETARTGSETARTASETARTQAQASATSAAGFSVPAATGNGLKFLRQKTDLTGLEYVDGYTAAEVLPTINLAALNASKIATTQTTTPRLVLVQVATGAFATNSLLSLTDDAFNYETFTGLYAGGPNIVFLDGIREMAAYPVQTSVYIDSGPNNWILCKFEDTNTAQRRLLRLVSFSSSSGFTNLYGLKRIP
jgi:cobalamin biosynthesis Mg chelatase CobN